MDHVLELMLSNILKGIDEVKLNTHNTNKELANNMAENAITFTHIREEISLLKQLFAVDEESKKLNSMVMKKEILDKADQLYISKKDFYLLGSILAGLATIAAYLIDHSDKFKDIFR